MIFSFLFVLFEPKYLQSMWYMVGMSIASLQLRPVPIFTVPLYNAEDSLEICVTCMGDINNWAWK